MNFDKYKQCLIEYLQKKGIDAKRGLIHCFSPSHEDKNPSCEIFEDKFICYSGNCGIHGDIFDAAGILTGITDKTEQFKEVEKTMGDAAVMPIKSNPKKETFEPDPDACAKLEKFISTHKACKKAAEQFLQQRETYTSSKYPEDVFSNLVKYFSYWPGYDFASKALGGQTLFRAGIPGVNQEKGYSSWDHSGIVIKLGQGYKLHYYEDGRCEKRGSKSCSTFPAPAIKDNSKGIVIVEGELDALACQAAGIENVYAAGGTNGITGPKIKKYLLNVPEIILLFDNDDAGKKSSGIIQLEETDKRKTNIPELLITAGYKGIIKTACLPDPYKDADDAVRANKDTEIKKAIEQAQIYDAKNIKKNTPKSKDVLFDSITIMRLLSVLKKVKKENLDDTDIRPFISACVNACKHSRTKQELVKWGATTEEVEEKDDTSPYFLIDICDKYGVTRYIKKELEKALVPESEILKKIKTKKTIIELDYEALEKNDSAIKFTNTMGTKSAAELVVDVLAGIVKYFGNEKRFYFFNGHVWKWEPDIPGIIYTILTDTTKHFLKAHIIRKRDALDLLNKIEGRRFRVEVMQDFQENQAILEENIPFDGPLIRESLTLQDGVIDFSDKEIIFRKSIPEEYRKEYLPYKIDDLKKATEPKEFMDFMNSNFANKDTLNTFFYYLSLVPSRNTQYKYGGIFIGKKNTGKTTTLEVLREIFPGMLERIPATIMIQKNKRILSGNEATPYIARLEGKGAAVIQESERNGFLNQALFKELTGGDTLTARGLYKEPRDFTPTAQIIIASNYSPRFDAHDDATIDRMVIIPFSVQHKKGDKNRKSQTNIIKLIKPEAPAIIKLLAEKYISLKYEYDDAIPLSDECKKYKEGYVNDMETELDKFVDDSIEFIMDDTVFERVQDVYERYLSYFEFDEEDIKKGNALSRNKFTRFLKSDYTEVNYKQKKIDGYPTLVFLHMKLKPKVEKENSGNNTAENDIAIKQSNKVREIILKENKEIPDENPFK